MSDPNFVPAVGSTVSVRVVPGAKHNRVTQDASGDYRVQLTARAVDGQANRALLDVLAETWKIKKRTLQLIKGLKSRQKLIKINDI